MSSGKKTVYTYDALGAKLRKQEYNGASLTRTDDYQGSVQYLNNAVLFAATGEGRIFNNSGTYRYDYFMKDQVGNIRLTYTANGSAAQVLQRDDYYPMGNTFNSYLLSGGKNNYLFNGMEFQENDFGTYDFHARMYDPQIGRTFQTDPHADTYASKSPFSFLGNNPMMITDPTGMDEFDDGFGSGGGGATATNPEGWFLNSGGYTNVSQKWQGVVYMGDRNQYYYKGKEVSSASAQNLLSSSRPYYTLTERYKDWYFYSDYTGLRYKESKLESRHWEVRMDHDQDYLNNQVLYGGNIWSHSKKMWTVDVDKPDKIYSQNINELRKYGNNIYINSAGLQENRLPDQTMTSISLFDENGINYPFSPAEPVNFNKLLKDNNLDANSLYFRYRSGFELDGTAIIKYGVIKNIVFDPLAD